MIEMDYSGLDFTPHINAVLTAGPMAVGAAIETLRAIAVEATPEDIGHLRAMAFTKTAGLEATLTFPGPYARYQHYELQLKHRIGQALYLEQPMVVGADAIVGEMGDVIGGAAFE